MMTSHSRASALACALAHQPCSHLSAGLTAADLKGQAPRKLSHFLAALSDLEPGGLPYKTEFAERDSGLVSSFEILAVLLPCSLGLSGCSPLR